MISKTPLDDITKLNKICASAQIGWWEVNFTTEQCSISETLLKALGAKSELLSIDELMSTIRQDYRKRIADEFLSIPKKGVFEQTFPVSSRHGNIFWIHCALSMKEENEQGQLIVTGYSQRIENPVTEGDQCVWSQRSEKLFHDIFTNIPVGLELYNKEGMLLDCNNRNLEIFGVGDKNRIVGLNLFESPNMTRDIHESLRAGRPGTFHLKYDFDEERRLFQSERRGVMDLDIRSLMLYDAEDNLSNYLLVNIDNTERNNALSKVHDFENFFSIISDYSKVGYAKINLLDHTGFAVRQWYRNLGESHDTPLADIIGIFSHMHPDDRKSVLDFYEKAKAGTERFFDGDLRIRPADGSDRWNWIHKSSMVTAYQSPNPRLELVEVNYDITVQKETEAELRAARDKAEESNRLKSAFLANISHEIRTPLNAIVGFSDLLMTVDDPAEQEEFRRTIQKNNTLLLQLFSDIIDLSKIDAGSFEYMPKPVCLYQFCAMMVQKMRNKVPEGVELQIDEDSPLDAWFSADSGYLNQVVTNFMSNAIKFTHRGTITVGYRIDARQQLEMFVEDTGIGISIENQEAVFDRFMKVDSFVQGTGLGLPLCKSIIEKMGGHIGVISELGKGSRFWFTLPAFSCIPTR
ncbi:putative autoinducer 2 sensor kinase/phosphatase, LuxQ-like [Bacteroides fragilis]|uniref:histidine kinase n=2 Tax=Bacteroides fragilis TaxID=817 RepID=A0A853PVD8_BACFG|nr:sensory box protein [Bacteroides fragilis str. 20793-3]OCR31627.1 sensor histidine kinase [Bacteroides fragilis]PJY67894.1 putative autoinducer 2 sensor kinase/phosphatase, LuxQ-like [Bacteroides fragilis]